MNISIGQNWLSKKNTEKLKWGSEHLSKVENIIIWNNIHVKIDAYKIKFTERIDFNKIYSLINDQFRWNEM